MTRRASRRDRVEELREASRWSSWTNTYVRWPWVNSGGLGNRLRRPRTDLWTVMRAAVIVIAALAAVGWVAVLLTAFVARRLP